MIVPAWNAGGSIERALRSVLDDPDLDLECIVIDDGCTDDTAEVVDRLAATDPRVVVLRAPVNEGVSSARNRALRAARGTWLTFLDADDRLLPGGLAAMLRAAAGGDVLTVVGQRLWTDGRRTWRAAPYEIPDIRLPGRKSIVTHPGLMYYASATGKLFHRSLIDGLWFEGRVLGDQPWTIRALLRAGDRIEVIDADVYEWRRPVDEASTTSITATKRASARLATEAARVAVGALAEVSAEADAQVADPTARRGVVAAYFERLVASDLAGPVRRAVTRADEGSDALFDAIGAFLAAAPRELVGRSAAVAEDILRAPLDRWLRFREPGRAAYLRLLRIVTADQPELLARLGGYGLLRTAVRILRSSDAPVARAAATMLLAAHWPFGLVHRLRRRRPQTFVTGGASPR